MKKPMAVAAAALLMGIAAVRIAAAGGTVAAGEGASADSLRWWKGNLHTHSLWSDGEDYPEMIAAWYREHGYHFVAITEHDMLQEGERWVDVNAPDEGWPPRNRSAQRALDGYRERFGAGVAERISGDSHRVRLQALAAYRHLFEEPDGFLLLMGEEITDRGGAHVNAIGLTRAILPRGGETTGDRIRANLEAVLEHEREAGTRVVAVVNHPNFLWALTAEELAAIPQARFFEVYNGHSMVNNEGDEQRAGTERIWDVVLTLRSLAGAPLMYGVATDDAHHYRSFSETVSRPGRGWVRVRAAALTEEQVLAAVSAGDFHASTGVALRDIRCDGGRMRIDIDAEPGVAYRTEFIGTRRGQDATGTAVTGADGDTLRTTRRYPAGVGEVLATAEGPSVSYAFTGDELYVRARIVADRPHIDPTTGDVLGRQMAWTQPVDPADVSPRCTAQAAQAMWSEGQATRFTE